MRGFAKALKHARNIAYLFIRYVRKNIHIGRLNILVSRGYSSVHTLYLIMSM